MDPLLVKYLNTRTPGTRDRVKLFITHYTNSQGLTPSELLGEAWREQRGEQPPWTHQLPTRLETYKNYLEEKDMAESTVKAAVSTIRSFYHNHGITTPRTRLKYKKSSDSGSASTAFRVMIVQDVAPPVPDPGHKREYERINRYYTSYFLSFSRQSLAIMSNLQTSLLNALGSNPKSSNARWLTKGKISSITETLFCSFFWLSHFSMNLIFSGVMMTFTLVAIGILFFLGSYIPCHLDMKTTFIYYADYMTNCQEDFNLLCQRGTIFFESLVPTYTGWEHTKRGTR